MSDTAQHFSFQADGDNKNKKISNLKQSKTTEQERRKLMVEYYYTNVTSTSPRGVEGFDTVQESASSSKNKYNVQEEQIQNHAQCFVSTISMYTVIFMEHYQRMTIHLGDLQKSLEFFSRTNMKKHNEKDVISILQDENEQDDDDTEWSATLEDTNHVKVNEENEVEDQSYCASCGLQLPKTLVGGMEQPFECHSCQKIENQQAIMDEKGDGSEIMDTYEYEGVDDETHIAPFVRNVNFSLPVEDSFCCTDHYYHVISKGISLETIHTMWDDCILQQFQSEVSIHGNIKRFFQIVKVFMDTYIKAMITKEHNDSHE